jgi:hypothetical protein
MSDRSTTIDEVEEWRWVPGTWGRYMVSSFGRVLSVRRKAVLKPGVSAGYFYVRVFGASNSNIHCLVAEAFLGPRPFGMHCRHLDGNKLNCRASNLSWDTPTRNLQDIKWHGGKTNTTLRPPDIISIRSRLRQGETQASIGRSFGISQEAISKVHRRINHADI